MVDFEDCLDSYGLSRIFNVGIGKWNWSYVSTFSSSPTLSLALRLFLLPAVAVLWFLFTAPAGFRESLSIVCLGCFKYCRCCRLMCIDEGVWAFFKSIGEKSKWRLRGYRKIKEVFPLSGPWREIGRGAGKGLGKCWWSGTTYKQKWEWETREELER